MKKGSKRTKKGGKYRRRRILLFIILCIFVTLSTKMIFKSSKTKEDKTSAKQIRNIPEKNEVNNIAANNQQGENVASTPKNYKDFFSKDLFLGDSITEGLSFYEILDESNVAGIKGLDTIKAAKQIRDLIKINPKNIYILIGANDIDIDRTSDQFANRYCSLIDEIRKICPNSKIYVQSILPITAEAEKKNPTIKNSIITEYNTALKSLEKNEGITFLDIASILQQHPEQYEGDGEHVKKDFYTLWLDYVKNSVETSSEK